MVARILARLTAIFFALIILVYSVVETSAVRYAFGARDLPTNTPSPKVINVTYDLPHPGTVYPGNPLWPAKAMRDKVSLELAQGDIARAEYSLHLADKRLAAGWNLWESHDTSESLSTLQKAEKYLEQSFELLNASHEDDQYRDLLRRMSYSSLKHREMLEHVLAECGDEARPVVTKTLDTSKDIYRKASAKMLDLGMTPPENPF